MDCYSSETLPRILPCPTPINQEFLKAAETNFLPLTSVPQVSLLVDDLDRIPMTEKPTFQRWKETKFHIKEPNLKLQNLNLQNSNLQNSSKQLNPFKNPCCSEDKVKELNSVVESQQKEIGHLRNECSNLRQELEEMKANFSHFSNLIQELQNRPQVLQANQQTQTQQYFEPMLTPSIKARVSDPGQISGLASSATEKSQIMNNLIMKYFPKNTPSKNPVFPKENFQDTDKSVATMNYLQKYRIIEESPPKIPFQNTNTNQILDISRLRQQTKLI